MTNPLCPKTERERDEALARLATAESLNTRYLSALNWIRDHARDEEALTERAVCGDTFHEAHQRVGDPDLFCPTCRSAWWATDGTLPGEEGSYALEAVAREALAPDTGTES